jgi:glycosyltransferase involved in cell wall biosynthesis
MVTGIYPTAQRPHAGTFVKTTVDSLVAAGCEVEVVHPPTGLPSALRYLIATVHVLVKTSRGRFDIVHGHYGLWCLVARMQWRTPVVATYLGDDLLGTVTVGGATSRKSVLVRSVSRWLCRHVDAVQVKTEQMRRASGCDRAMVIPSGIDFTVFYPRDRRETRSKLGWDPDRAYVLFANDPSIPVKNYPLARAVIKRLRARDVPVELIVASGLPHTTVAQYMCASNALILPSYAEGSPNVVKEAMACNVPVVAADVGDVADVIGRTEGCRVCPHDAEVMADALERALQLDGPTTGRRDIAHLASGAIAGRLLHLYDQARTSAPSSRFKHSRGRSVRHAHRHQGLDARREPAST